MTIPHQFSPELIAIADSMGVGILQRFDIQEACSFLGCTPKELDQLIKQKALGFIQITELTVNFFGYQLIEYLYNSTQNVSKPLSKSTTFPDDRIIRFEELSKIVGVSRVTIWRWEQEGKFPLRISLGPGSVGWRKSEIDEWIRSKKET